MNSRNNDPFDDYDDDESFMTFDARSDEGGMSRGPIILAAIVLLFLVFGAILWVYFTGNRTKPEDAPVISAQTDTFKEMPINGTGVLTEDIDKSVYDATTGTEPPPLEIEAIGGAEQPMLKPSQTATPAAKTAVTPPAIATKAPIVTPKPAAVVPKAATPSAPAPKVAIVAPKPAVTTPKPAVSPSEKAPVSSGSASAQLGSFPSKAAAEKALADLRDAGLEGPAAIFPADLGSKGTWYRVKATGLKSRDEAIKFCSKAKAAGASCIPSN